MDHVGISGGVRTGGEPGDFHRIGARPEFRPRPALPGPHRPVRQGRSPRSSFQPGAHRMRAPRPLST